MTTRPWNKNILLMKSFQICLGLLIVGIGNACLYDVGWGSAPAATVVSGFHIAFHLSYTTAGVVSNLFFLLILLVGDRKIIHVGTLIATFFSGFFIDTGAKIVAPLSIASMTMPMKVLMMILGCVLTAIGLGYYVAVEYGTGAIDGLSLMVHRKTGWSFRSCRWGTDLLLMVTGVALGAAWGVGTLSSILLTGPIMQTVIRWVQKPRSSPS